MKFSQTPFQSRVARRLFMLFLFSSLIPILTLGYLSYNTFTNKLLEQTQDHLHKVSKSIGYTVIERLDFLQAKLDHIAHRYLTHRKSATANTLFSLNEMDGQFFNALAIRSPSKKYIGIYNEIDEFPELSSKQLSHILNGNAVVAFSYYSTFQTKIMLVMAVNLHNDSNLPALMIGEINQNYLWEFENIVHHPAFSCIATSKNEILNCSNPGIDSSPLISALKTNNASSAMFNWSGNNMDYSGYYWTIFLEGKFATKPWMVVISQPRQEAQASIDSIKSIYPIVITLSFLMVLLLTTSQIRRILNPLLQLQSGTREIAGGNFSARVEVDSNDEFEDLAQSFNDMATRLDLQFKSLETMAEIDRIILSSTNKNYIVDTVLTRLKDIVPCEYIQLSIIQKDSLIVENDNNGSTHNEIIIKNVIEIEEGESKLLLAHSRYMLIKATQFAPRYAREIVNRGVRSLVVFPIIIKESLYAIVVLGFKYTLKPDTLHLDHARELTDRIAVALSTASKEEKIYEQANFDSLTKLPNRTLIHDRLDQAVQRSKRGGTQIATILIDLDRFKNINDSLGYTAGDQLLVEVATRLSSVVSDADTLGRLSGDEFVVIISDIKYVSNSTSQITGIIDKILGSIKTPFIIKNHEVMVSASVGIAIYPADTVNTEDLLRFAEIAMYHAKSQGKGAYQFYSKDLNASSIAQLVLENNLRQAIRNDELDLYYQPQFEADTGKIICAEALLRWHHPELGDLAPADVLPIADSSGLIVPIGEWVLRKTCQQIRTWLDKNIVIPRIAVNLSAHQFREKNLIKRIKQILKEFDVDVQYLELEITEDTIMKDIDNTSILLRTLNEMGIKLAVDDFGTGYSSLNYLAKFPIHYLKIDRSFVRDVTRDPNMASIVSAIIALAHGLRLQVVAEGVETQEQFDHLEKVHCDIFQGNLLSLPVSSDELTRMLENPQQNNWPNNTCLS